MWVVTMSIEWWLRGWFYLFCCDNWLPGRCSLLSWWLSLVAVENQRKASTKTWRGVKFHSDNRTYFSGLFFLPFISVLFRFCLHNEPFLWEKYFMVTSQYQWIHSHLLNIGYFPQAYLVQMLVISCHLWILPYHSLSPFHPPYSMGFLGKCNSDNVILLSEIFPLHPIAYLLAT